jgi:hypothetical protein
MNELEEYRIGLLQSLENRAREFRAECLAVKDPYAPWKNGYWNVHQIAAHTRDADKLVYGLRVRRTAMEDNPEFASFDGNAHMEAHYDPNESLNEILDGLVQNVQGLVELLRALPVEAWSRVSRHTTFGSGLTLQSWVEKDLAHIEEHLKTIRNKRRSKSGK